MSGDFVVELWANPRSFSTASGGWHPMLVVESVGGLYIGKGTGSEWGLFRRAQGSVAIVDIDEGVCNAWHHLVFTDWAA